MTRYRGGVLAGLVLALSAAALTTAWTSTGSGVGTTWWWLAVVLVGVLLPGWSVTRSVRGGGHSATDLGWAGPAGLLVILLTWLASHLVGVSLPSLVVGPAVAGVLLVVPATRRRVLGAPDGAAAPWPVVAWLSLLLAALAVVRWMWVGGLSKVAAQPSASFELYYQDLLYQTALAGELRRNLVPGYPMVDGEPLGYHWFYHAVAAQLGGSGFDDLDVVTRLLPATLVVLLVLLAGAVGQQVAGHWAGAVGASAGIALLRPVAGDTWRQGPLSALTSYWQLSPTATLGWVFGLASVGCLVAVLRRAPEDVLAPRFLLPCFVTGAAGAKSSAVPVVICGVGLAALVVLAAAWRGRSRDGGAAWRQASVRYALCLLVLVICMLIAATFIYPGSYGLRLDPRQWVVMQRELVYGQPDASTAATGAALVVGFIRRWVLTLLPCLGLVFLVRRRPIDPTGWIGLGVVIGGLAAVHAFSHPGGSQLYFPIAALPIAYALSGAGVGLFLRSLARPQHATSRLDDSPERGPREVSHRTRIVIVVALVAAAIIVEPLTRRLVASGGTTPRALADGAAHSALDQAWTWVAPSVTVLVAMLVLAAGAWLVVAPRGRRIVGSFAVVMALVAFAAGIPTLLGALAVGSDPGTPRTPPAASDPAHPPAVTPALFEAGQYLRHHANPSDVIATNRVWNGVRGAAGKDNRDFSVSALSGLRTVVSGYGYAPRLLEGLARGRSFIVQPFWDQPRLDAELALIEAPTAERAAAAYRSGARWILADERSGPVGADLTRLTDVVLHRDGVWLARLRVPPPSA